MDIYSNIEKTQRVCNSVVGLRRLTTAKVINAAVTSNSTTAVPTKLISACNIALSQQNNNVELQVDQHIPALFSVRNLRITDLINDYLYGYISSTGVFCVDTTTDVQGNYVNPEDAELSWRTGLLFELFPAINAFLDTSAVRPKVCLEYLSVLKEVTQDSDYQKKSGDFLDEESLVWANKVVIAFFQEILEKISENDDLYAFTSLRHSRENFTSLLNVVSKFCLQENVPRNIANRLENVKETLYRFIAIPVSVAPLISINEMHRFDRDTFGDLKCPVDCMLGTELSFFLTAFFREMETKMEFPVSLSFVYRNVRLLETSGTNEYSVELGDFAVYPRSEHFCQKLANSVVINDVSLYCVPIGNNSFVFRGPQLENLPSKQGKYREDFTWNLKSLVSTQDPLQSRTFSDSEIFESVQNCSSQREVKDFYYSLKHSVVKSIVSFVVRNIKQKFIQNKNIKPEKIKKIISTVLYRGIRSACFHPHVNENGLLCPGSTASECTFFINNKRLSSFSHLIKTLLKTHNINSLMYSSLINMYSFFNGVCSNCNLFIADNDLVVLNETCYHRSCCIQLKDGTFVSSKEVSKCTSCGGFERKDQMKRIRRGVFNCPECQSANEDA